MGAVSLQCHPSKMSIIKIEIMIYLPKDVDVAISDGLFFMFQAFSAASSNSLLPTFQLGAK